MFFKYIFRSSNDKDDICKRNGYLFFKNKIELVPLKYKETLILVLFKVMLFIIFSNYNNHLCSRGCCINYHVYHYLGKHDLRAQEKTKGTTPVHTRTSTG